MQLRMKLAAITVAGAASVALVAGVPALASSHAGASKAITGPEVIAGAVHGKKALVNATVIPLRWRGLVRTKSVIKLGGGGPHKGSVKTLRSPAGNLTVMVTSKPHASQSFNAKSCRFSFAQDIALTVVGGTSSGAFAGASGPAAVQVSFGATAPRFKSGPKKGQCNPKGKPIARTAVARFLASAVLTLK
jgi:hypothetical protein